MKQIKLTNRLQTVANLVNKGGVVADIATDHGFLICWLAQQNLIKKGYACDINPLPLASAQSTIDTFGVAEKVETVLTDGLIGLEDKSLTHAVIAGVGGELITEMLDNSSWVKEQKVTLILQPMTREYFLREYLYLNGYEIMEEQGVICGDFSYTGMRVVYTGVVKKINPHFAWSGMLWDKTDEGSISYLKSKLDRLIKMEPSFTEGDGYKEMLESWKERFNQC